MFNVVIMIEQALSACLSVLLWSLFDVNAIMKYLLNSSKMSGRSLSTVFNLHHRDLWLS